MKGQAQGYAGCNYLSCPHLAEGVAQVSGTCSALPRAVENSRSTFMTNRDGALACPA